MYTVEPSQPQSAWSKEAIIGLRTIGVMLLIFDLGYISRRRLRSLLAICFRKTQSDLAHNGIYSLAHNA